MLRLLKYELRKTLFAKLILLAITVVAEAIFLAGYWRDHENTLVTGAVLLFIIAVTGIALMGILSLVTLHKDMNTKQGYMLFMTPNSCYKILGAKVIECGLSLLLAGAFFFGLGMLDFDLLLGRREANRQLWEFFTAMLQNIDSRIVLDAPTVSALVFFSLSIWLCIVTTAYLSDVISSSLLNGRKGNLVITFILFLALTYGLCKVITLASAESVAMEMVWQGVIALGLSGVMYVITARLMEKYLSV